MGDGTGTVADKEAFLTSCPPLAGVPAVRDRRLFALPYAALPCAALVESPRNPAAIVAFANYLASIGE